MGFALDSAAQNFRCSLREAPANARRWEGRLQSHQQGEQRL
jgi:hypothetical protein